MCILRQRIEYLTQQLETNQSNRQLVIDGKPPPSKKNFRALESQVYDNVRDVYLLKSSVIVLKGQVAEMVAAIETRDKDDTSKHKDSETPSSSALAQEVTWLKRELLKERHWNNNLERRLETVETLLPNTDQTPNKHDSQQDSCVDHEGIILWLMQEHRAQSDNSWQHISTQIKDLRGRVSVMEDLQEETEVTPEKFVTEESFKTWKE